MHLYTLVMLFWCFIRQRRALFFHRHTCIQRLHSFSLYNAFVYTCHAFLVLHQKIFVPYIILFTARLSLFHTESLFFPLKYIVYRCYSCFRQRRGHFFHRHTCIQWLQSFSLYNAFVYTCHAFLVLQQKIFVPYIILFTARLSLFHTETLFSPLKYIVYRCYSCIRQRRAQFFHRHTCIQWLHSFSLYNALYTLVTLFWCFIRKYIVPYIILFTARLRGARWLSGRVSDSGARGPGFETYRRRVVSLSKTLYSPKVLVNYPGSDGSVPT